MTCIWRGCSEWIRMPEVTRNMEHSKVCSNRVSVSLCLTKVGFEFSPFLFHLVSWGSSYLAETKGNKCIQWQGKNPLRRDEERWVLAFNPRMRLLLVPWSLINPGFFSRVGTTAESVTSLADELSIIFKVKKKKKEFKQKLVKKNIIDIHLPTTI